MAHGNLTVSTFELLDMIPDAEAARLYLEERRWHGSPYLPTMRGLREDHRPDW